MDNANESKHNLPSNLTRFIGRVQKLAEIERLFQTNRLITLTGPGGVGKTRLAIQAARELLPHFQDGVWLVRLAQLTDPALLTQTLCASVRLHEAPGQLPLDVLIAYLQSKKTLVVLDNCEHLVAQCAQLAEVLLSNCPAIGVLATSREALNIPAEIILPIPSLALPPPSNQSEFRDKLTLSNPLLPQMLQTYEAVQFFIDRAQAVQPDFEMNEANAEAVARLCHLLDGIPLALELAAARVKVLSVTQIATRLDDSFQILTGGSRTALPRQQTLRALIEWSYNLLTEREQIVFRRLAVFRGGWTLEAAEESCVGQYRVIGGQGKIEQSEVFELLSQLINKSLVQVEPSSNANRYRLLETVRQYAGQKLAESRETNLLKDAHADYFLALAEQAVPLLTGVEQVRWLNRLETEYPNLRIALSWLMENGPTYPEKPLRLAAALWHFWQKHSHFSEGRYWLSLALSLEVPPTDQELSKIRAKILRGAGVMAHISSDFKQAAAFQAENLQLQQALDDKIGQSQAWLEKGWAAFMQTDFEAAYVSAKESWQLVEHTNDKQLMVAPLYLMAFSAVNRGDTAEGIELGKKCLVIWRELEDWGSISSALNGLALGYMSQQDYQQARIALAESLELQLPLNNPLGLVVTLDILTKLVALEQQPQQAARLRGFTIKVSTALPGERPPSSQKLFDEVHQLILLQLDETIFERLVTQGQQMSLDQAITLARALCQPGAANQVQLPTMQSASIKSYPANLTEREVEVLRLVATGLSNPEIAAKLVLSRRTVEAHLRSIFAKIEVASRTAATHYAMENGLL